MIGLHAKMIISQNPLFFLKVIPTVNDDSGKEESSINLRSASAYILVYMKGMY